MIVSYRRYFLLELRIHNITDKILNYEFLKSADHNTHIDPLHASPHSFPLPQLIVKCPITTNGYININPIEEDN